MARSLLYRVLLRSIFDTNNNSHGPDWAMQAHVDHLKEVLESDEVDADFKTEYINTWADQVSKLPEVQDMLAKENPVAVEEFTERRDKYRKMMVDVLDTCSPTWAQHFRNSWDLPLYTDGTQQA